jgi:hypothetical protein
MRKRFQILIFLLISSCFTAYSQTASLILPSNFSGPVGTEIEIPITVTNFDSVCNVSMVFSYDTSVLTQIEIVKNPTIGSMAIFNKVVGQQFRFGGYYLSSINLTDGDWLFKIRFLYHGGNSPLQWDLSPDNCVIGKCNIGEKPVNWVNGNIIQPPGLGTISGSLLYDNALQSPMSNCTVILQDSIGNPLDTTLTDESGLYAFQVNQTGNYGLRVVPSIPVSSVNSTDALLIIQHFVGLANLNGLALKAADVNDDSNVNSTDALIVLKRFVGLQTSFLNGDWVFDIPSVSMPVLSPLTIHMKALFNGDTDRSFVP